MTAPLRTRSLAGSSLEPPGSGQLGRDPGQPACPEGGINAVTVKATKSAAMHIPFKARARPTSGSLGGKGVHMVPSGLAWGGAVPEGLHAVLLAQLRLWRLEKQHVPAPATAGVGPGSRWRVRPLAGRGTPRVWQQSGRAPETALPTAGARHWWRAGGGKAPVQQLVRLRRSPALPVRTSAYPPRSTAREPRCGGRMD